MCRCVGGPLCPLPRLHFFTEHVLQKKEIPLSLSLNGHWRVFVFNKIRNRQQRFKRLMQRRMKWKGKKVVSVRPQDWTLLLGYVLFLIGISLHFARRPSCHPCVVQDSEKAAPLLGCSCQRQSSPLTPSHSHASFFKRDIAKSNCKLSASN